MISQLSNICGRLTRTDIQNVIVISPLDDADRYRSLNGSGVGFGSARGMLFNRCLPDGLRNMGLRNMLSGLMMSLCYSVINFLAVSVLRCASNLHTREDLRLGRLGIKRRTVPHWLNGRVRMNI